MTKYLQLLILIDVVGSIGRSFHLSMNKIVAFVVLTAIAGAAKSQCPSGYNEVRFELDTDSYNEEISWLFYNPLTGIVLETGSAPDDSAHVFNYCIPSNSCHIFRINDEYGDGMSPDGVYRLFLNDTLILSYTDGHYFFKDSIKFGCPPGGSCSSAIPIDTGSWATPNGYQTWYRFVPADTGIYEINTCNPLNACGSKIWVYNKCDFIFESDNLAGADFYAAGGCDNGALASLYLAGNQDYYIRIRYEPANCDTTPIHFTLSYSGPIIGCTDPAACNYQPLATVTDTCLYPGDPNCASKPDLAIRQDILRESLNFVSFPNTDQCTIVEGCLRELGVRHLIRFTTWIENVGDADYYIGAPPDSTTAHSDQFIYDPCHQHWHYLGYAEYILYDQNGYRLAIGSKTGFCILDLICPDSPMKYNCINMGISAGCSDVYDAEYKCQWADVTGLPSGDYTLVVRVNWDKSPDKLGQVEATFDNNWAQACFSLSYPDSIPEVQFHNEVCPPYVDCAGEVFGAAQPDCNGICNGPALQGDLNQDTLRNASDIDAYLAAILGFSADTSKCFDLDGNGLINIYDAGLLQECIKHQAEPQYWVQRYPCQFPAGSYNSQDAVFLKIAAIDTVARTVDIQMANLGYPIMGYQFSVSGLNIASLENLAGGFNPDLRFEGSSGLIVGLGRDESAIAQSANFKSFLRIHYSGQPAPDVCIAGINAVFNASYQRSNAYIEAPACIPSGVISRVWDVENPMVKFRIRPNPFRDYIKLEFEDAANEPLEVLLSDVTGRVLRTIPATGQPALTIYRENLPDGVYFISVKGVKSGTTRMVIAQ